MARKSTQTMSVEAQVGLTSLELMGDFSPTVIKAKCAYL